MKKLLSILIPMLFIGFSSFGQVGSVKLQTLLVNPANGSTINDGVSFNSNTVIRVTQGTVLPTDTIYFQDWLLANLATPSARTRTGVTLNVNDTIQFNLNGLTISNGSSNTFDYCAIGILLDRNMPGGLSTKHDTTGGAWRNCNSVNYVALPASVGSIVANDNDIHSLKVNIFPNPAVGNNINMDFIAQNSSDVEVNVFDLTGRKVLSHSFGKAFKGQEDFSLDISGINKGMYILELRQDGVKATGQFIK